MVKLYIWTQNKTKNMSNHKFETILIDAPDEKPTNSLINEPEQTIQSVDESVLRDGFAVYMQRCFVYVLVSLVYI